MKKSWLVILIGLAFIFSCTKEDFVWDLPKTNPYEGIDTTGVVIPNAQSPVVITTGNLNITTSSFDVTGNINALGSSQITHYGHCWSTNQLPDTNDNKTDFGIIQTTGTYTSSLSGLTPNTNYYVRAYASNSFGLSFGNQIIVKTNSLQPPTVTSGYLTTISSISASILGNLISEGSSAITSYGHCWVSNGTIPTVNDSKTDFGNANTLGAFTSNLNGLSPNQNYKVRAYAVNDIGTSYGDLVSFTTSNFICDSLSCSSLNGINNIRYNANLVTQANGWIVSNSNSIFGDAFLVGSCHGGYIEFLRQINSDFKLRFWIQSYEQGSWSNIIPFVYINNELQSCTIIDGNNYADWVQLETNTISTGGNKTIKIEFPYNGNSIRNYYIDQIEFSCY